MKQMLKTIKEAVVACEPVGACDLVDKPKYRNILTYALVFLFFEVTLATAIAIFANYSVYKLTKPSVTIHQSTDHMTRPNGILNGRINR